jgi:predicted dehydrogenase
MNRAEPNANIIYSILFSSMYKTSGKRFLKKEEQIMSNKKITRRKMIKSGAATAAAFTIIPRHVMGGVGYTAACDANTKAIIGYGNQGPAHNGLGGSQVLAVSDVDSRKLTDVPSGAQTYQDWREVIARDDVDVVHLPVTDHWKALMAIAAAEAGKDVWTEKPMFRTIGEGIKLVEACQRNGTIFRINTWYRAEMQSSSFYGLGMSVKNCRKMVMGNLLGKPIRVMMNANNGFDWKMQKYSTGQPNIPPESTPNELDYDMYLGPAPSKPYTGHRVSFKFRGYWDYGGGGLGDMGTHHLDPVQYILGKDDTSPVEIIPDPDNGPQHPDAVSPWVGVTLKYADGDEIVIDGTNKLGDHFMEGPNGYVGPNYASNIPNLQQEIDALADPPPQETDFMECVRERKKFALNEVNGFRSTTLIWLGIAAIRLGRNLKFDPVKLEFIDDEQANRLIWPTFRAPWNLSDGGV